MIWMGEKEIELDSDLEESIRRISRDVLDERVTKIKFGAQILRTVRKVIDENETGAIPVQEIRKVVKLVLLEYTGISMMIGGGITTIFSVAISLNALSLSSWMFGAIMNQMIFMVAFGLIFLLIGYLIYDIAKKKLSELEDYDVLED